MIRLHHCPGSRSMRVLWALEELGLDYDLVSYRLDDGSTRRPELMALSPAGRVPALEIDGQAIFESGAIIEYLCERFPEAGLGVAPGTAERARFLEWVHFAETQANILQSLNIQHIFLRPASARSPAMMQLETRRLVKTMQAQEAALAGRDWLLDKGFTGADLMMAFNVTACFRFVRPDGFANLAAYAARIAERPAYARALARSGEDVLYTRDFYELPEG